MKLRNKILVGTFAFLVLVPAALALVLSYSSECGPAPALSDRATTMQAIVYRCYGGPEVLQLEEIEKPVPGDNEVLVKIHAAGVNPLDWHYMRGSPYVMRLMSGIGAPSFNRMGADFSGTVESVGSKVTRFAPGDEIFGGKGGAFGQYVSLGESRAMALKPADATFEEAAATPVAAVTALQALRDKGQLKPGQKVLINGASGGVGTYAVQIAKAYGAEVTGVCSTRNVEMVLSLGADHVFDYTRESYTESGKKYDLIIDNVGNHSLLANSRVMTTDGILVMVGGAKGNWVGPFKGMIEALLVSPFLEQSIVSILAEITSEDLAVLAELMQSGKLRSVIDRRYPLDQVDEAIAYSETGRARGKIVINVD